MRQSIVNHFKVAVSYCPVSCKHPRLGWMVSAVTGIQDVARHNPTESDGMKELKDAVRARSRTAVSETVLGNCAWYLVGPHGHSIAL